MPRPKKQIAHLEQARNTKKTKLDKDLEAALSEDYSDKEDDDEFIYETDNYGDEWFNETMSEELDDVFTKLINAGKDRDVWKTGGRPQIYTGSSSRTLYRNKSILKKAAKDTVNIKSFFQVSNKTL